VKRPFSFHLNQGKPTLSLIGLTFFFLLFVLGCRGGNVTPSENPDAPVEQQGSLVCNEACAARGQCGKTLNGNQSVILGNPDFPAVQAHQMTFPADVTLPIVGVKDEIVQVVATGEQFTQSFFLIKRADERVGWVAGWCVNPQ
jgi:hypothetical protein